MTPLHYSLCDHTVTLYRIREESIQCQVINNCYFALEAGQKEALSGKSRLNKFLLIIPGDFDLQPGDRVFDGIGSEEVNWQAFAPAFTDGLYEVGRVKKQLWEGEVTHVEGRQAL